MKERNLRARRYLQAESIVNNLKNSAAKPAIAPTKKVRKNRKRASPPQSIASSVQAPAALPYRTETGEIRKVQFVIGHAEPQPQPGAPGQPDTDISISEMFLRKYRQLLQNNLVTEDFYTNVAYDKEKELVTLYNEDKEDGFEIYERVGQARDFHGDVNDIMKEEDFELLVKDYQLNNLYC